MELTEDSNLPVLKRFFLLLKLLLQYAGYQKISLNDFHAVRKSK